MCVHKCNSAGVFGVVALSLAVASRQLAHGAMTAALIVENLGGKNPDY